jgi:predicted PurR-regulated permease PerM
VQHIYFFVILGFSGYLVWQLFAPFVSAIILAGVVATICYPLYEHILQRIPSHSPTLTALLTTLLSVFVIVIPLVVLLSFVLREAASIYSLFNTEGQVSFISQLEQLEAFIQTLIPSFSIDVATVAQQTAGFIANNLVNIFAGTASTILLFIIALVAAYYFFKDGKRLCAYVVYLSPLEDAEDSLILARLAKAIRSVALGTVSIAMLQGVLTAIGLTIFGFDRAILWGCVAAMGALIPGIGTTIVFVPAVLYMLSIGAHFGAVALGLWGLLAVGLIDNLLGPYVMSRGNNMHPFLILLSVLGGISVFGPVGFIFGPVILSLFLVLLEIYHTQIQSK